MIRIGVGVGVALAELELDEEDASEYAGALTSRLNSKTAMSRKQVLHADPAGRGKCGLGAKTMALP